MKTILRFGCALSVFGFCLISAQAAPSSTNETALRLTVELRDGSRVIGQGLDSKLKFHSSLLGDLKLDLKNIRAIDCSTTNSAKLTTTAGDMLTGWFIADALRIKTGFGTSDLPVSLIRSIHLASTSPIGELPSGLVALWSGEGDGTDSIGGNQATMTDVTFVDGKVGQAFSFNGTSSYIKIPDSPALDVGAGSGFTVTAWIKPARVDGIYNVIEWSDYLCAFEIGKTPSDQGLLVASVYDSDKNNHFLRSGQGAILPNVFQHVAVTYDKASGIGTLYINGFVVQQSQLGSYVPLTKGGLRLGYRPSNPGDWTYQRFFYGLMDEIAIYNRALSTAEIKEICLNQNNGQSPSAPATSILNRIRFGGGINSNDSINE